MAKNNSVFVCGYVADEPVFEAVKGTPYLRFNLLVPRDETQVSRLEAPRSVNGGAPDKSYGQDLLRIVEYGHRARVDFHYLTKGAEIAVYGWNESRVYQDTKAGRRRRVQEVNAQRLIFGRGCDFERGDQYRQKLLNEASAQGTADLGVFGLDRVEQLAEAYLAEGDRCGD